MSVEIWVTKMVVAAGKELLVFDPDDVRKALKRKFILAPYGVYFDRVKGVAYMVRGGCGGFGYEAEASCAF